MTTFVAAVFVFGLLIFIHELGHFLVAKRSGILVHEFALGFGPKLAGIKRGDTLYSIRAFPLGGFVRMAGMDPNEDEAKIGPGRSFKEKPVWKRMAVIFAGPLMNLVLAAVLLAVVFLFQGLPMATTTVGEVLPDRPALAAGVRPGDRIVAVDGAPVRTWAETSTRISEGTGREIALTVERGGERLVLRVKPMEVDGRAVIGIRPMVEPRPVGVVTALGEGVRYTWWFITLIFGFIGQMFFHQAPAELAGPVRIVAEIGDVANRFGFLALLQLAAFLSVNLGLFNLFPIPALDGSRLMFLAWEGISGRPVNPEKEGFIHLIGFGLLLVLMVVVTYNDIMQLIM
ncbi:MAG: RIP metalloprotease RseP [Bacillota bacterium]|nr:RIP metalloprotease RseP [Bacillota bacterium]